MSYNFNQGSNNIMPIEKLVSILSYFTFGIVGFVWIIIGALNKQMPKPFLRFHIYQSIFLSVLFFIVSNLLTLILNILGFIPYVNVVLGFIVYFLSVSIINIFGIHLSIIQILMLAFLIYLSIGVHQGKLSFVPWVSNIIKYNVGR